MNDLRQSPLEFVCKYLKGMNTDDEFLIFFLEQLLLRNTPTKLRRYSAKLYSYAYFWRNCSTSCYKLLCETFSLPSITQLNRLTSSIPSAANSEYLTMRCSSLVSIQRTCVLIRVAPDIRYRIMTIRLSGFGAGYLTIRYRITG